jgi:uncharacterized protein (TIGR02270 family)
MILSVVAQHADELASLWITRGFLTRAGQVGLTVLREFDERLAAHLDGCVVAGATGIEILRSNLDAGGAAEAFALAVASLESNDCASFDDAVAVAEKSDGCVPGLESALGWVGRDRLLGHGRDLLGSASPFRRRLGLAACRLHAVDPTAALTDAFSDVDGGVVAEALRVAVALGKVDTMNFVEKAARHPADGLTEVATRAAVLLGNRTKALEALIEFALRPGAHRRANFRLALQVGSSDAAHQILQLIAADPKELSWLIEGSGIAGDPIYVSWLIKHMRDDTTARRAGESFSVMTAADLVPLKLDRPQTEGFEARPNDDPDDDNVEMDPDEGLPWPDPDKVERWWAANAHRFHKGTRYFMGAPVTRAHCIDVLNNGYQRQRILAAHYLCLLDPGTPLFNTSAPAWRQQRRLARM